MDGEKESETLTNETTTKIALDQIIAVGPAASSDDSGSIDDFSLLTNLTLPLESVEASSWGMPSDTFAQYENSA